MTMTYSRLGGSNAGGSPAVAGDTYVDLDLTEIKSALVAIGSALREERYHISIPPAVPDISVHPTSVDLGPLVAAICEHRPMVSVSGPKVDVAAPSVTVTLPSRAIWVLVALLALNILVGAYGLYLRQ